MVLVLPPLIESPHRRTRAPRNLRDGNHLMVLHSKQVHPCLVERQGAIILPACRLTALSLATFEHPAPFIHAKKDEPRHNRTRILILPLDQQETKLQPT